MAERALADEDVEQDLDGVIDLRDRTRLVRRPVVGAQAAYHRSFGSWLVNYHRKEVTTGERTVCVHEEVKLDQRAGTNPAVSLRESGWACVVLAELTERRRD